MVITASFMIADRPICMYRKNWSSCCYNGGVRSKALQKNLIKYRVAAGLAGLETDLGLGSGWGM